jgi:ribosomal protein L22
VSDEDKLPQEAKDSAEEASTEAAAEQTEAKPKRRRRRKAAEPEAAGTAAEATGSDQPAAEAADEPAASADKQSAASADEEPAAAADDEPAGAADDQSADASAGDDAADDSAEAPEPAPSRRRRSSRGAATEEEASTPAPSRARRPSGPPPLVRARARYVRTSPRKARLVADHVRGKTVEDARAILAFSPREVARDWSKVLESAVANAEHNHELVGDELRIAAITADEGPTLKRYRPRAMGRATRIRKRTSHLTITLTPTE